MSAMELNNRRSGINPARLFTEDDIPNCSVSNRLILELITDDEVDLGQLADVVQENPSLAVLIISLANSAYFSFPKSIDNINDAIIKVLGISMFKSIVLSVILGKSLDVSKCTSFSKEDYWVDSLTSARSCQILVAKTEIKNMLPATKFI